MRNKALLYTLSEGGNMQPMKVEVYQDELENYTQVEKRKVFVPMLKEAITSRAIKIGDKFVHSLFFEDGKIFDCGINGFLIREGEFNSLMKEHINKIYKEKTNG